MGGKVGKILPLVALAAAPWAIPAMAGAVGVGASAGAAGGSALFGSSSVAGIASATTASNAAAGGLFSSLASGWSGMSTMSKFGVGMQGLSTVGGLFGAGAAADQQDAMLAMQEGQNKLQNANDGLDLSQRSLNAENRLKQTLAAMTVRANAFGADLSSGSSANLMDAGYYDAKDELGLYDSRRKMLDQGGRTVEQTYDYKRRAVGRKRSGAMVGSLLDLGVGTASTFDRYGSVGRA